MDLIYKFNKNNKISRMSEGERLSYAEIANVAMQYSRVKFRRLVSNFISDGGGDQNPPSPILPMVTAAVFITPCYLQKTDVRKWQRFRM